MPKISGLAILTGPSLAASDLVTVVDGSDPTMSPITGTNKQMTATEFAAGIEALNPGTALLGGRAGGQTFAGGTGPDDDLIFKASSAGSPTGDIIFRGGAAGATELGRMLNNGHLTWSSDVTVGGTSTLFGDVTTAGGITAASVTASGAGTFVGGQTIVGPGVSTSGGFGGLTFVGSEQGAAGNNAASCLDLRGGRSDGSGNPALNLNGDMIARLMYAGSTRRPSQPKVGVASINVVATENWTDSGSPNFNPLATGCAIEFWTTPNGTTTNHGIPDPPAPQIPSMRLGPDAILAVNGGLAIVGTSNLFGPVVAASTLGVTNLLTANGGVVVVGLTNLFGGLQVAGTITIGAAGPQLMNGAVDPSAGAGVAAPQGSIYMRTNGGANTSQYIKTGASATSWTPK